MRYVRRRLLPAMRLAGTDVAIEVPPASGTRSSLFRVRVAGSPPLLLRSYARRRGGSRNVRALRHLEALNLPAPRLVHHDLRRGGLPLWGPFFTVETWIEGRRVSSLRGTGEWEPALLAVARLLGRFREATRPYWGPPERRRLSSYAGCTMREVRVMLRAVRARGWLGAAEASRARQNFALWRGALERIRTFSLAHRDPHADNFLLTPAGDLVPVDLHRLSYEPFPEEAVTSLHRLCPDDPGLQERFLGEYFAGADPRRREWFEEARPFFEPLYFLKKLYRWALLRQPHVHDERLEPWSRIVAVVEPPRTEPQR